MGRRTVRQESDRPREERRTLLRDALAQAPFNGNKAELGRRLGYKDGSHVGQMLGGRRPVSEATIAGLQALPELRRWFAQLSSGGLEVLSAVPTIRGTGEQIEIDQFDTGGAMGHGVVLRDQPGVIQSWRVTPEWIQKNVRGYSSVKNLCIVTGFGDSMRPMFNPGDPLLVDSGVTSVEFDAIYFFGVDGEGFIKRLQRIPGEGVIAISENKAYRDWTIRESMNLQVYGRVLKVWRGEDF